MPVDPDNPLPETGEVANVRWQYMPAAALTSASEAWLAPAERALLATFRSPLRQADWLRGRMAAKQLLMEMGVVRGARASELEITTRNPRGQGIPPEVRLGGERLPIVLSLSHTAEGILVACGDDVRARVGVDLVRPTEIHPEALSVWLTPGERSQIDRTSAHDVAAVWAAKEAVYKAACVNESFAPMQVETVRKGETWSCRFFGRRIDRLSLTTREIDGQIAAIAVVQPARTLVREVIQRDGGARDTATDNPSKPHTGTLRVLFAPS